MANNIHGPLNYQRAGRAGPVIAFVHPNPMDQSCWLYQMAHFSTWFRCIAVDLPGYGRSPKADPDLTMADIATACWEAVDDAFPGEPAIVFGCSVGALIAPFMHNLRPDRTRALVVCGTGYEPKREFARRRIESYRARGIDFRHDYAFQCWSPAYRATAMAHYFADLFAERNDTADVDTIVYQFEALIRPELEDHHAAIKCPTLILSGSEDAAHHGAAALQARIAGCELKVLPGAGHACQMEQPWLFDRYAIAFLSRHGLFPAAA